MTNDKKVFDYSEDVDIKIPVKGLKGKDYELREASAADARTFKKITSQAVTKTQTGAKVRDPGSLEYLILTFCLWDVEAGQFVSKDVLETFNSRHIVELSEEALKISGLDASKKDDEDENDLKN